MNSMPLSFLALRSLFTFGCLVWGSYLLAMFRTQGFGFGFDEVGGYTVMKFIFVAPPSIFPFIGLGWRRIAIAVLAVCAGSFTMAEVFAQAQERLVVRRYGKVPTEEVSVRRWWPFEYHDIFYDRNYGWSSRD